MKALLKSKEIFNFHLKLSLAGALTLALFLQPFSCVAQSKTPKALTYDVLKMRDYDEMLAEVRRRIVSAEKLAQNELKLALLLIFSRPDSDNMVSKLTPLVRVPLKNIEQYELTLEDIVARSIFTAKDKSAAPKMGATSLIVLENFMSEMRPEIKNNQKIKNIFLKIRDAKIKASEKVQTELRMRAMLKTGLSPSETADKILRDDVPPPPEPNHNSSEGVDEEEVDFSENDN